MANKTELHIISFFPLRPGRQRHWPGKPSVQYIVRLVCVPLKLTPPVYSNLSLSLPPIYYYSHSSLYDLSVVRACVQITHLYTPITGYPLDFDSYNHQSHPILIPIGV